MKCLRRINEYFSILDVDDLVLLLDIEVCL